MAPDTTDQNGGTAASRSSDLELEVVAGDAICETITVIDELVIGRHVLSCA